MLAAVFYSLQYSLLIVYVIHCPDSSDVGTILELHTLYVYKCCCKLYTITVMCKPVYIIVELQNGKAMLHHMQDTNFKSS